MTPHESMRDATLTVLLQISYCGFWAPITPAITGPWFSPMRSRKRWNDSRLIESNMDIKAIANSTNMTTLCSSVRFSSCDNKQERERERENKSYISWLLGFPLCSYSPFSPFRIYWPSQANVKAQLSVCHLNFG